MMAKYWLSMSHEYRTLLVTGGAGFIGSAFVAQCVARGMTVIVLDKLTYAGSRANLQWIISPSDPGGCWRLVVGDIADNDLVSALCEEHQPDAILNFAAESHVDNSISSPNNFITTNIVGTFSLLESAYSYYDQLPRHRQQLFRYIQISTDEVYGSLAANEPGFTENHQIQPNSPYSASKAGADHLVRAWQHTYGLPAIITRCSNNYGPRQYPEKFIPHMIDCALKKKPMPLYGDGGNVRDWIHVEDHVEGIFLALTQGKIGEAYNFGGRNELRNSDLLESICELLDTLSPRADGKSYSEQITLVMDRPGHDRRYAMDDSMARKELGFTNTHDFAESLRHTVEWYLNNQDWCRAIMASQ